MIKRITSKRNRNLISEMIRTDFKLKYQGSILGYLWTLLKPLLLFAILYTVFSQFLRLGKGIPNYPTSLLLGIVLWSFFAEASSSALKSIVGKGNLIRKISIPRYLIPVASISSALINALLNLIVVFVFVLFTQNHGLSLKTLIILPLLLIELTIIATATGFFLGALFVKFRDIEHIWEVVRQALFYTIPIIYPLSLIGSETIYKIILANPLAQILQDARSVVTYPDQIQLDDAYGTFFAYLIPFVLVSVATAVGAIYFKTQSKYFAEEI